MLLSTHSTLLLLSISFEERKKITKARPTVILLYNYRFAEIKKNRERERETFSNKYMYTYCDVVYIIDI